MKRLSKDEIEQIRTLVTRGVSLNNISKQMGRSKTTIYHHFRKLKGRTIEPHTVNLNDDNLVGEFVGLFAGDGGFYLSKKHHYRVSLYFGWDQKKFINNLISNVLVPIFNRKPLVFNEGSKFTLIYNSKVIYKFIKDYLIWDDDRPKTYSVRLISIDHSLDFIKGFVRGSLDSDGHLSDKLITFASVSFDLMKDVSHSLDVLEIDHRVGHYREKRSNRVDIYSIYVKSYEINKFWKLVQPRNLTKVKNAPAGIRISV